jgi:hypothetical protein
VETRGVAYAEPVANSESSLQTFTDLLREAAPDARIQGLFPGLAESGNLEKALALLRRTASDRVQLRRNLEEFLARDRAVRQTQRQLDQDRVIWRLKYERRGFSATLLPSAFLGLLVELLDACGVAVSLSLEKRPRPLLHLGPALPLGTEGLGEFLDVDLAREPGFPDPLTVLNNQAAEGLRFLSCEALPPYATPVLDLTRASRWAWPCPPGLRERAQESIPAFLAAPMFSIEKSGKQNGQKTLKQVEIRRLVRSMDWTGNQLRFELLQEPGQALHPAKLLGGILGVDPAEIRGLVRTGLELSEDPRLAQGERFQPKLKNIFEDAVLLRAESNLKILDEDEDEPLQLH